MTKDEVVLYWLESSELDYKAMENLFENGHYVWALFAGHLVIEKLLKAYYVRKIDIDSPRIHNLVRLAEKAGLPVSKEQEDFLFEVTTFNIKARYPDFKRNFHRKASREFTQEYINKIKEFGTWLSGTIQT